MIGHYDELVEKICSTSIVIKGIDEEFRPGLALKKGASAPSGRRDHVRVSGVCGVFSRRFHSGTSAAKAAIFSYTSRRALKARPFKADVLKPCSQ